MLLATHMILGAADVGSRKTGVMPDGLPVLTKGLLLLSTPIQRLREGKMQLGTLGGEAKGLAVCLNGLGEGIDRHQGLPQTGKRGRGIWTEVCRLLVGASRRVCLSPRHEKLSEEEMGVGQILLGRNGLPRILFRLFGEALLMVEDRHPEEGAGMTRVHLEGRLKVCHRTKW